LKDDLAYAIMDGYRYRHGLETKENVKRKLNLGNGEDGGEQQPKKKPRRLKEVYLVNKEKYHSIVTERELLQEIREDDLNESTHKIIQQKIR
jgi:hypothetical protein